MIRNTVQRQIVLNTLKKMDTHPTVEEVYQEIHKDHPTISKATVYRNLRQLAKNREIRQILLPDELERYDKRANQHYHFKCKNCGVFYDIDIDYPKALDEAVRQKYGFEVDEHDVLFRGICPKCRSVSSK
jgi:Fe2+ or Zn2+ uptake regulation protein